MQFSKEMTPKCGETCPISERRKMSGILSRLWLSWFFRSFPEKVWKPPRFGNPPQFSGPADKSRQNFGRPLLAVPSWKLPTQRKEKENKQQMEPFADLHLFLETYPEIEKFILARTHEKTKKNIPPCTKEPFSRLNISFSV